MDSSNLSVREQIAELERQIINLRHRAVMELKVRLAEARHRVVILEREIKHLTEGSIESTAEPSQAPGNVRKRRVSVSIHQIANAIRAGHRNYSAVARSIGCSSVAVAKRIAAKGDSVGIKVTGEKRNLQLSVS